MRWFWLIAMILFYIIWLIKFTINGTLDAAYAGCGLACYALHEICSIKDNN